MTANDNNNIDLGGVNLTLTIADNQTLNYQPCVSEIVVSIRLHDKHFYDLSINVDGINFKPNSNVIYTTWVDGLITLQDLQNFVEEMSEYFFDIVPS